MKQYLLAVLGIYIVTGCTGIEEVKPWEKENHARDIMSFAGLNPEIQKLKSHTYNSKEASRGGAGVVGGGCGCN